MKNKIVAVSGGADSLALLHMLYKKGEHILAAHFNHNLRPSSDSDAEYVHGFCEKLNVPCVIGSGDVSEFASENKLSIETAGRRLRYAFFADVSAENSNAEIATAHHANDAAESFIMHLLRGSGLGGLCGISPERDIRLTDGRTIHLVRPLINITRAEIEQYCQDNGIVPLVDESNDDTRFFRNKARHEIMPVLYENGGLETITKTTEILRVDEEFLSNSADEWIQGNISNGNFSRNAFLPLHQALKRRVILRITKKLTEETIPLERVDAVISMIEKNIGNKTIELPGKIKISMSKGEVSCYIY